MLKGLFRGDCEDIDRVYEVVSNVIEVIESDANNIEFLSNVNKRDLFELADDNNLLLDTLTYEDDMLIRSTLDEDNNFDFREVLCSVGDCLENTLLKYQFTF